MVKDGLLRDVKNDFVREIVDTYVYMYFQSDERILPYVVQNVIKREERNGRHINSK